MKKSSGHVAALFRVQGSDGAKKPRVWKEVVDPKGEASHASSSPIRAARTGCGQLYSRRISLFCLISRFFTS